MNVCYVIRMSTRILTQSIRRRRSSSMNLRRSSRFLRRSIIRFSMSVASPRRDARCRSASCRQRSRLRWSSRPSGGHSKWGRRSSRRRRRVARKPRSKTAVHYCIIWFVYITAPTTTLLSLFLNWIRFKSVLFELLIITMLVQSVL